MKGDSIVLVRAADGQIEPVVSLERIALVSTALGRLDRSRARRLAIALERRGDAAEVYALDVEWP